MKKILILLVAIVCLPMVVSAKPSKEVVKFYVYLHCEDCVQKIMHNIGFEKGVRDIECSIPDQTVVVTFNPKKTDIPTLQKAFAKMGKPATTTPPEDKATDEHHHHHHHGEHGHNH